MDKEIWLTAAELEQLLNGELEWSDVAGRLERRLAPDLNEDKSMADLMKAPRTGSGIRRLGEPLPRRVLAAQSVSTAQSVPAQRQLRSRQPDSSGETQDSGPMAGAVWARQTSSLTDPRGSLEGARAAWLLGIAAAVTLSFWVYFVFLLK